MAESFFASLEAELIDRSVRRTHDKACPAVFDRIGIRYSGARLHSALGVLSPDELEMRYRLSQTTAARP
ncbi:MAG: hypothetical protein WCH74_09260 [Chloroflexota bacterium]